MNYDEMIKDMSYEKDRQNNDRQSEDRQSEDRQKEDRQKEDGQSEDRQREDRWEMQGKVSVTELPAIKDSASTNTVLSAINQEDDWIQGRMDDTYLSLNYFLHIDKNYYRVLINDNSYRIIVNEYNQDNQYIGYVDLSNGDILNIKAPVNYITLSIYRYMNRRVLEHSSKDIINDLNNGLEISLSKIDNLEEHLKDKELLTAEVNIETLSNYNNYRVGWYKSWGGTYETIKDNLCTRNLYKVDSAPYIFNVNDSRITGSITEYDLTGKWLKFTGGFLNGATFIKQAATSYIGLTIKSRKWGLDLPALFEDGLRIDLASEQYIESTGTIPYAEAKFADPNGWMSGAFLFETGEYIIDREKICYKSFCRIDDKEYMVHLPGGYLKMILLELDQNGKVLYKTDLQSGQKWKRSNGTDKIALTISGLNKTFTEEEYKNLIKGYPSFGLKEYVKYAHNTKMQDITAGDYVNGINVGWNLGNSLDSMGKTSSETENLNQEVYWGNPYVTKDLIDYVANSEFNTIRIPVTWYYNTYKDGNGILKISQQWLNRVQDVVNYAIADGLYVIINSHHDQPIIYAGTDEVKLKEVLGNAKAIWTDIAEYFKSYDEHLAFESYNEVDNMELNWNYSDKAAAQMNQLNQVFVDTVRASGGNNDKRILIVPTLLDGTDTRILNGFTMPMDTVPNKIAAQVHTYNKKFHQDIESDFAEMEKFTKRIKAPLIIGEFGSTRSTFPITELIEEHASNFVARAAKRGIKCIWWDNGSDYGIIDRRDFSHSNMQMLKALMEGAKGIGYELEKVNEFKTPEGFVYLTPNINTGELTYTYWGTLTTDIQGKGLSVAEGKKGISISLKAVNEAASVWLQRVLFYHKDGALVQKGKEIQSKFYIGSIPEGAVTVRASFNSPTLNITLDNYKKYLTEGDIELLISMFNPSDVKKVTLTLSPYK